MGTGERARAEEEELIVKMHGNWETARKIGEAEGRAGAVLTVLQARGIAVPDAVRDRILAQQDPERLERWLKRAVLATSADAVLAEPEPSCLT